MFKKYCTNCDNLYDLTKSVPLVSQSGGNMSDTPDTVSSSTSVMDLDDLINKILNGDVINLKNIGTVTLTQLSKNPTYKKLQGKNKELVYNKFSDLLPKKITDDNKELVVSHTAFFLCKNCGHNEPIKHGTAVVRRSTDDLQNIGSGGDNSKYKNMIYASYIPRTRNYVCPNSQCKSHKDHNAREAVFFRQNNSYRVQYVCTACTAQWTS